MRRLRPAEVGLFDFSRKHHHTARTGWRELMTLLIAAAVYFGGRILVEGSAERSFANAHDLLRLESRLGLDIEADVQQFALDHDVVRIVGNLSYVWLHWPLLLAALVILFWRDPVHYRQLRSAMFLSGAAGLVLFTVLPMAPPRFMDGFVGTVSDDARRHFLGYPMSWANKFAAFPSFHVGWTLIACLALAAALDSRFAKAFVVVPAVLVGIAVVTTGNHYMLDSFAGAAIALGAYAWFGRRGSHESIDTASRRDRGSSTNPHRIGLAFAEPLAADRPTR